MRFERESSRHVNTRNSSIEQNDSPGHMTAVHDINTFTILFEAASDTYTIHVWQATQETRNRTYIKLASCHDPLNSSRCCLLQHNSYLRRKFCKSRSELVQILVLFTRVTIWRAVVDRCTLHLSVWHRGQAKSSCVDEGHEAYLRSCRENLGWLGRS
jgi:hypothetical protein